MKGTSMNKIVSAIVNPLRSRKVRVAVATVIVAYAADRGLGLSEETVLTVLSVGVALILGIAHEDNGAKQRVELLPMEELKTTGKDGTTDQP